MRYEEDKNKRATYGFAEEERESEGQLSVAQSFPSPT